MTSRGEVVGGVCIRAQKLEAIIKANVTERDPHGQNAPNSEASDTLILQ